MDSSRLFHLFIISLFSAAVALLGLNELSHRFMKSRTKQGAEIPESRIVKELSGEVNVLNPLAGRPTEVATAPAPAGAQGANVYGAVREKGQRLMEKLLPKE